MLEFPRLTTGPSAQYPLQCEILGGVKRFTFLDGKQQRFPARKMRRRWILSLGELREDEAADIESFALRHRETGEPFRFTDPLTGRAYFPCYLEGRVQQQTALGPGRKQTVLVIVEGAD